MLCFFSSYLSLSYFISINLPCIGNLQVFSIFQMEFELTRISHQSNNVIHYIYSAVNCVYSKLKYQKLKNFE